ncbi:hypothetical protein L1887_10994 [Cichorium endivia]|nr:hypothetical protein L1887_10994 [Cichorium endivia]
MPYCSNSRSSTSTVNCPMTGLISPNSTLGALSEGSPSAGPTQEALVRVFEKILLVVAEADGGYSLLALESKKSS